jgi:hypothetical protein
MTNTLKRLGWGGAIALIACVATARGLAQRPDDPFHDRSDTGEIVHVLPTPASIHSPHDTQPTDAPVASGTAVYGASYGSGSLTDHGGPEISNAAFKAIYWNGSVANAPGSLGYSSIQSQISAFISYFGTDGNYSGSPTDDYSIVQQYGSKNPIAAGIQALGFRVDTQSTASKLSDRGVQNYLASLFNSGLETPSANTLFGIYFPSGMKITLQGGTSCSSFCGYHSHFTYNGTLIKYAVFPYTDCRACSVTGKSVADILTIVTSHEIREAVTDSLGTAWYDAQGYEADDKCAWHNLYQMTGGGFWVQPEYSNGGTKNGTSYPGPGCVVPNR